MRRPAAPMLWMAVLLAVVGALAVLERGGGSGDDAQGSDREVLTPGEGTLLVGAGGADESGPKAPRLQGLAPEARLTHGPVLVRVVDLEDRPLAGVMVTARWGIAPEAEGDEALEGLTQGLTNALGHVSFDDLPYTGAASVAVQPRSASATSQQVTVQGAYVLSLDSGLVRFVARVNDAATLANEIDLISPGDAVNVSDRLVERIDVFEGTPPGIAPLSGSQGVAAVVRGPAVTLCVDPGIPLRVEVREGGNGRLHPDARWRITPRLVWSEEAAGASTLPVPRGQVAHVALQVDAPRGTLVREVAPLTPFIHPTARRLDLIQPVRPTVRILVVFPPEVQPFRPEDWEGSVSIAGVTASPDATRWDAQGRLVVEDLAYLPGEAVEVQGKLGERWHIEGRALLGATARELVLVAVQAVPLVRFREESGHLFEVATRLTGIERGLFYLRMQHVISRIEGMPVRLKEERSPTLLWAEPADDGPRWGGLEVMVLTPAGLPAPGALVLVGDGHAVCDARGRAHFPRLAVGALKVRARGVGAGASDSIEIRGGGTAQLTLRAVAGGLLEVEVVDEQGRGLPYAHLALEQPDGAPWMDLHGEVQRIDPYTDADGRRLLRSIALGRVKVTATFGSRQHSTEVDVTERSEQTLRLVLPSVTLPSVTLPSSALPSEAPPAPTPGSPPTESGSPAR